MLSPEATPIATGTRPSRRASKAMTRSRNAGQTKRAVEVEGRDEDLADGVGLVQLTLDPAPTGAALQAGPPIPNEGDVEAVPEVEDGPDTGMGDERSLSWRRRRRDPAP